MLLYHGSNTDIKMIDVAMCELYASAIYDKISDVETGLYRESPAYVFGLLQDEMNFGRIVQTEL